ncbi:hypothetical protein [Dyadobacter sp. CY323]|uniref:hypothetical protein n=1 Tax=Dyadobacter sp. CY323 TaxID=2907302 RepID=UPI001F2A0D31|nr:hypothetical protein [Dyadobacter sp. CY323]MCE6992787.1 hypothetical protein [Dyadobacter sp. CY323]
MKKYYFILFNVFCVICSLQAHAQDAIYFANGNNVQNALITKITEEMVSFQVKRDDKEVPYSFPRENVLIAFLKNGNYLVLSVIQGDPNQFLQTFLTAPPRENTLDIIVKTTPVEVITGKISYESDEIINFESATGQASSIAKEEISVIIYKDGSHKLLLEPTAAAAVIVEANRTIRRLVPPASRRPSNESSEQREKRVESEAMISKTDAKPALSEEDYNTYSKKALQKVDEFSAYLNIITDKSRDSDEKDKAIEQASKLFMPTATIEVTSKYRASTHQYKIQDYLSRLKLLPYSRTNIEWMEVQYVNELKQEADGNYYGNISGQQTFTGYSKNGKDVLYSDVTRKNVKVKLQSYDKSVDGQQMANWEILLGNIGISVNQ